VLIFTFFLIPKIQFLVPIIFVPGEYNFYMQAAIFLDRDGVIVENRESYIRSWSDVVIYPDALQSLARIQPSDYRIFIVTNQSAVGRGIISLEQAWEINHRLVELIRQAKGRIDGVYMCPHAPMDECDCRKPKPGLFLQAARQYAVDLSNSLMIGDALSDLLAAQAAGISRLALVRSGRGAAQELLPRPPGMKPFLVFDTFADALDKLICAA
jgi:D-glycero-D-manno-heptose 1,7-bisphosphate phosphatase